MTKKVFLFGFLLLSLGGYAQKCQLSGYVKDAQTGEALVGASVFSVDSKTAIQSNHFGFFSMGLSIGKQRLLVSLLGYRKDTLFLNLQEPFLQIEIKLQALDNVLEEVQIRAEQNQTQVNQISVLKLSPLQIKQMPIIFGEKDPIKAFQFLPGVQAASEGSSMFVVRGGGADQNLLLLDQAPIYNANHLFGFISTFNPDPIKHIELYKGGFPARYGGRLSSVVDVQMKEGNQEEIHGEAGIGLVTSRLHLEAPIVAKKSSFLIAARRTYADALPSLFLPDAVQLRYYFYDLNAKINTKINDKNHIYWSIYTGKDKLTLLESLDLSLAYLKYYYGMNWGNVTSTLRWNHLFSQKLFSNTSLIWTKYDFNLQENYARLYNGITTKTQNRYLSNIKDLSLKSDFDYFLNDKTTLRFGGVLTNHAFLPQVFNDAQQSDSLQKPASIKSLEINVYAEFERHWNKWLLSNVGLRGSSYGVSNNNKIYFEPRLLLSANINTKTDLKLSYARTTQFMHQLSNTGVGFPTDLWVPSTETVPVSTANQIAFALEKRFSKGFSATLETYHKWLWNILTYKENGTFILTTGQQKSSIWEQKVSTGKGWAWGWEFLLKKETGKLQGWCGYTLSWVVHQFPEINFGNRFYARQDRRHDFELVSTYQLRPRLKAMFNWTYASGNPITAPLASYSTFRDDNINLLYYGAFNAYRTQAIHRLDLGVQLHRKKSKKYQGYWDFSLYNAYNRKNPFYYAVETIEDANDNKKYEIRSRSLFPIIPSVSYNIKF